MQLPDAETAAESILRASYQSQPPIDPYEVARRFEGLSVREETRSH